MYCVCGTYNSRNLTKMFLNTNENCSSNIFAVSWEFMAGVASQAEDADSSRAPDPIFWFPGVHECSLWYSVV